MSMRPRFGWHGRRLREAAIDAGRVRGADLGGDAGIEGVAAALGMDLTGCARA